MAENIVARDLMKSSFLRLGAEHTLREAVGILLDPRARSDEPRVFIILERNGDTAGLLTTRYLLQALLPGRIEDGLEHVDPVAFEQELLGAIQDKLELTVRDAMRSDVPTVAPGDRLHRLVEHMRDRLIDCVPVVDGGRILGVVYLADVFGAVAQLALASYAEETDDAQARKFGSVEEKG